MLSFCRLNADLSGSFDQECKDKKSRAIQSSGISFTNILFTSFPFISRGIIIFVLCPVYSVIDSVPSSFIELSWYSKIVTPLSNVVY